MTKAKERKFPNILFIVLDTVRQRNISLYGYEKDTMPYLENFGKKSTIYTNAVSPSNWTLPSHASMLTGLLPFDHMVLTEFDRLSQFTIAEFLKEFGYKTVAFSTNGWVSPHFGIDKGFEEFYEFDNYRFPSRYFKKGLDYAKRIFSVKDYGAEEVNDNVSEWVKDYQSKEPFFMFINYSDAHSPYNPPRPFQSKFGGRFPLDMCNIFLANYIVLRRRFGDFYKGWKIPANFQEKMVSLYDGSLSYLDQKIKNLFRKLREFWTLDDMLIIITSDHGECFGEDRPLRILKHQFGFYEDLIKVPLVIKYPSYSPYSTLNKRKIEDTVSIRNIPSMISKIVEGDERFPKGDSLLNPRNGYCFSEYLTPPFRKEELGKRANSEVANRYDMVRSAITNSQKKFVKCTKSSELYNLSNDPNEKNNLESKKRKRFSDLINSLEEERAKAFEKARIKKSVTSLKKQKPVKSSKGIVP